MSRHRLTKRKKAFCEALVSGMTQTDAARKAGYSSPKVQASQLLVKDKGGRYEDRSIESYMRELTETKEPPAPKGKENVGATTSDEEGIGDAEEVLGELFAMLRDPHEPGGTRIRAAETLLKALGADRPQEVRDKDADAAAKAIKTLLGIRDDNE